MFVIIKVCGNVAFIVKFWPDVCSTCFLGLNRTRITEMSPRFIFKRCFFVLFSSRSGDPPPCSRNPWWPYFCHIFSELVIIVVFCKVPLGSLYLINCESVSRVTCFLIFWVFITLSHLFTGRGCLHVSSCFFCLWSLNCIVLLLLRFTVNSPLECKKYVCFFFLLRLAAPPPGDAPPLLHFLPPSGRSGGIWARSQRRITRLASMSRRP